MTLSAKVGTRTVSLFVYYAEGSQDCYVSASVWVPKGEAAPGEVRGSDGNEFVPSRTVIFATEYDVYYYAGISRLSDEAYYLIVDGEATEAFTLSK